MTSNRTYHQKESPFDVFSLMEKEMFGIFDQRVISAFLINIGAYYIGDFVKICTGDIGEIVYINPNHISQPIIRVNNMFIDLSMENKIKIVELI